MPSIRPGNAVVFSSLLYTTLSPVTTPCAVIVILSSVVSTFVESPENDTVSLSVSIVC